MTTEKIISFEKEKNRIQFKRCNYVGSITINIGGDAAKNIFYSYQLESICADEVELFLSDTISDLLKYIDSPRQKQPIENILNKVVTIDYYLPKNPQDDYFIYQWEPAEISTTQLFIILTLGMPYVKKVIRSQ